MAILSLLYMSTVTTRRHRQVDDGSFDELALDTVGHADIFVSEQLARLAAPSLSVSLPLVSPLPPPPY